MKYKFKIFSGFLLTLFSLTLASCFDEPVVDPVVEPEPTVEPETEESTIYTVENFTDYFDSNFQNPYAQNYLLTSVLTYNVYEDFTYEELSSSTIRNVENRWFDGDVLYKKVQEISWTNDGYYLYEENDHLDLYVYRVTKDTAEIADSYLACQTGYSYIYNFISSLFELTSHREASYSLSKYNWTEGEEENTFVTTDFEISSYLYMGFNSVYYNTYTDETPFETTVSINDDGTATISINVYPQTEARIHNTTLYIEDVGTTEVDVEEAKWDIESYTVTYERGGATIVPYVYNDQTDRRAIPSTETSFAPGTKVGLDVTRSGGLVLGVYLDGERLEKDSDTGYYIFEMPEHNVTITALT